MLVLLRALVTISFQMIPTFMSPFLIFLQLLICWLDLDSTCPTLSSFLCSHLSSCPIAFQWSYSETTSFPLTSSQSPYPCPFYFHNISPTITSLFIPLYHPSARSHCCHTTWTLLIASLALGLLLS